MKKYTLTLLLGFACVSLFAQSSNTNGEVEIGSTKVVQGEKANYPEAKYSEATPEIKGSSNTGGVQNKSEILMKKDKNSNQKVYAKPVMAAGSKPKNN